MIKKLFAAFTALLMLCGTAAAYTDSYGNDGLTWDTAYQIKTYEDLTTLKGKQYTISGTFYKLEADIVIPAPTQWESWSNNWNLNGHFDGQNHTITFNENEFLFSSVNIPQYSDETAIKNLNVSQFDGGIGGIAQKLNSGTIDNCTFTGTIRTTGFNGGGIVGEMDGGTIKNCKVSGTIRTGDTSGGIVGYMSGGNIEGCTVASGSSVATSGGYSSSAGGIVGYIANSYGANSTVKDCTSYASVSEARYTGGIIGEYSAYNSKKPPEAVTGCKYTHERAIGNYDDPIGDNKHTDGNNDSSNNGGNNSGSTDDTTNNNNNVINNGDGNTTIINNGDGNTTNNNSNNDNSSNDNNTTIINQDNSTNIINQEQSTTNNNQSTTNNNETDNDNKSLLGGVSAGGGGGCNTFTASFMLLGIAVLKLRKH